MSKTIIFILIGMLSSNSYKERELSTYFLTKINNEKDIRIKLIYNLDNNKDLESLERTEKILKEYYQIPEIPVGEFGNLFYFDVEEYSREWWIIVTRTLSKTKEELENESFEDNKPYFSEYFHSDFVKTFLYWKMLYENENRKQIDYRIKKAFLKWFFEKYIYVHFKNC